MNAKTELKLNGHGIRQLEIDKCLLFPLIKVKTFFKNQYRRLSLHLYFTHEFLYIQYEMIYLSVFITIF